MKLAYPYLYSVLGFWLSAGLTAAAEYGGLWIGQVTLNAVSEVSVPLNEDNVPIAPIPEVTTPTHDQAYLRLILHVNGAGQVSLLKDVALLDRTGNGVAGRGTEILSLLTHSLPGVADPVNHLESDLLLITDERLYGAFPPQPAIRIASAAFDFGDANATEAVNRIVAAAVEAASGVVDGTDRANLSTAAQRREAENLATGQAIAAALPILDDAKVSEAYSDFLRVDLPSTTVEAIAADVAAAAPVRVLAVALRDNSFYRDTRAVDLIDEMVIKVTAATTPEEKTRVAKNLAATYADVTDKYHRFLASKIVGDMIVAAAEAGAQSVVANGPDLGLIRDAVNLRPQVNNARVEAIRDKVSQYETDGNARTTVAVDLVIDAIINNLAASTETDADLLALNASEEGLRTLANDVLHFDVPAAPTGDYNEFVESEVFSDSVAIAARAAAVGAVFEKNDNLLSTPNSIRKAARVAALNALRDVYAAAARAVATELAMSGDFAPGAVGLTGTINLPANHPTNPFRHRRHPSHTVGFDIQRTITLDFDAVVAALERADFNVDRVTGIYSEEIHGLHKPLGPRKNIGLKVSGVFELNRISLVESLNAPAN